jgi:hypothetical protein
MLLRTAIFVPYSPAIYAQSLLLWRVITKPVERIVELEVRR